MKTRKEIEALCKLMGLQITIEPRGGKKSTHKFVQIDNDGGKTPQGYPEVYDECPNKLLLPCLNYVLDLYVREEWGGCPGWKKETYEHLENYHAQD